jgi:DNA polymerase-3 subunit delta
MELKSNVGLDKALEYIKNGKVFPVYLICGDENYIIKEAAQNMIEAILSEKDREICLETIEGDEEDWGKIIQSLNTYPMFGSRNVIAVKDTKIFLSKFTLEKIIEKSIERFENKDINEAIRLFRIALGYLKIKEVNEISDNKWAEQRDFNKDQKSQAWLTRMVEECLSQDLKPIPYEDNSDRLNNTIKVDEGGKGIPQNNILVLITEYVDKRKKLYKTINDIGVIIDFSIQRMRRDSADVEEEERKSLLQKATELLKRSNKVFAKGAFDVLANKTGYNMGIFLNELEKVVLSVKDRQKIEVNDIEETVGRTREDSIFDLQEAIGRRDLENAILFLGELLGQGEFYLVLLQSIAKEIWHLIVAKQFMENELKGKWNSKMDEGAFKKYIYFPVILKMKKEKEKEEGPGYKKSPSNIYKLPPDVLLKLLKSSDNFTKDELYRFIKLLAETDLKTKTTGVSPVHLLEKALVDICLSKGSGKRVANL